MSQRNCTIGVILFISILFCYSYYSEPREAMAGKKIELIADETYSQSHGAYIVVTTYNDAVRVILEKEHKYYKMIDNSDDGIATQSYSYYFRKRDYNNIKL